MTSVNGALEYLQKELKVEGTIIAILCVFGDVMQVLLQKCVWTEKTLNCWFQFFFSSISISKSS